MSSAKSPPWEAALRAVDQHDGRLVHYNVVISGRRTSMKLDAATWSVLGEVARRKGLTVSQLCTKIEKEKPRNLNYTFSLRRYLMLYFRARVPAV